MGLLVWSRALGSRASFQSEKNIHSDTHVYSTDTQRNRRPVKRKDAAVRGPGGVGPATVYAIPLSSAYGGSRYSEVTCQVRAAPRLLCSRIVDRISTSQILFSLLGAHPLSHHTARSAKSRGVVPVPATPRCHATSSVRRAPPAAHARGERRVERSPAGGGGADEPEAALAPLGAAA